MNDRIVVRGGFAYQPELDGIRAFAVMAVIVYHGLRMTGYSYPGGFLGVDVFFVLSGYLITTLLLREHSSRGRIRLGNFYVRRALRLLPALFLAVVFGGFVVKMVTGSFARPYTESAVLAVTYVANWFQIDKTLAPLGHVWSLSIEEQYYVVWPALLLVALRFVRSRRALAYALVAVALAMAVARYVLYASGRAPFAALSTFTRPDGVVLGSALALFLDGEPSARLRSFLTRVDVSVAAVGVIAVATFVFHWQSRGLYAGGLTVVNVCTAVVVGHLVCRPGPRLRPLLASTPLPQIGRISYGLYLYHVPMLYLVTDYPPSRGGWSRFVLFLAGTFAIATVSYALVERPILKLKSRFGSMSKMPERASLDAVPAD